MQLCLYTPLKQSLSDHTRCGGRGKGILSMQACTSMAAIEWCDCNVLPLQVLGYEGLLGTIMVSIVGIPLTTFLPGADQGASALLDSLVSSASAFTRVSFSNCACASGCMCNRHSLS